MLSGDWKTDKNTKRLEALLLSYPTNWDYFPMICHCVELFGQHKNKMKGSLKDFNFLSLKGPSIRARFYWFRIGEHWLPLWIEVLMSCAYLVLENTHGPGEACQVHTDPPVFTKREGIVAVRTSRQVLLLVMSSELLNILLFQVFNLLLWKRTPRLNSNASFLT